MDRIPKSINPCPIKEAIVEIRFEVVKDFSYDLLPGLMYSLVKDEYNRFETIANFPPEIYRLEPNLRFKPVHKIVNKNNEGLFIQLGHNVLSINLAGKYTGWSKFSTDIFYIIRNILSLDVISSVTRLGFRYINFFGNNISENTHFDIRLKDESLNFNKLQLIYSYDLNGFQNRVNYVNNTQIIENGNPIQGTLIDIDTFKLKPDNFFKLYKKQIDSAHDVEKVVFYGLLEENFVINNLNPTFN